VIGLSGIQPRDFPPKPQHFKLPLPRQYECLGVRPSYMFRFRVGDRAFQIGIALGSQASAATRDAALRILNSFTTKPR
jgi:hypothetical protein